MLQGEYREVLDVQSRADLHAAVVRFSSRLGFSTVTAMAVVDDPVGGARFITVDNTPPEFEQVFRDESLGRRDPVMQHCKSESWPIIWDQSTYVARGLGDLWEEQARFGLHTGIAVGLHLPDGRHFVFGVDRDRPLPRDVEELTRLVADLQLFAVYAQDAALKLLLPELQRPETPRLTPREIEVLKWTMEGKTASETGQILGITERTAVLHITNAMHKLNAPTKHVAVLKALRLGLIV